MKSKSFNIIYRVCDSVNCYNRNRATGDKVSIILKSAASLAASIAFAKEAIKDIDISIHIVYDKTSVDTKNKIKALFSEKSIEAIEHSTSNGNYGNMASFKLSYDIASRLIGYIFFLEDDYLLDRRCILEMFSFLNMWKDDSHICIKPHEDMNMFTRDQVVDGNHYRQREILLGRQTYWMRDISSTCTFCVDDFILKEVKDNFEKTFLLPRVDEQYLNKIYERFPLFAPILPLGIHFQNVATLPPFFGGKDFSGVEYDATGVSKC